MKAAILHAAEDLRIEETDDPTLPDDGVVIGIQACGVCPSDVRWFTGARVPDRYPRRLGHEWSGRVLAVGKEVADFRLGDRVAADWRAICGSCHECRRGAFNFCSNRRADLVVGGYAEQGVAVARNVRRIPDHVSYEEACFCEPLACCLSGSRKCGIQPADNVVILGAGQIGLLHAQLAQHQGARVIVCDRIESRLEKARALGASETINVDTTDAVARVLELTEGRGAEAIVVAVGVHSAADAALRMAALNGTVNLFAGFYPPGTMAFDPNLIHYRQIHLTGSHDFTPHDFTMALKLIADGTVRVEPLISHRLPLRELHAGLETVRKQEGLKVVIEIRE